MRRSGLGDLGLQIGPKLRLGGSVGKVLGNVQKAEVKAVKDVGHTVGAAATNKYVLGTLATGLALTGVGAPAAAGILAATKGGGALIKKGGNLKSAATGAYQGAILGAAAGIAPTVIKSALPVLKSGGSLLKRGASGVVDDVKGIFGGNGASATDTTGQGANGRRRITNGDADAVTDAKNKKRKAKGASDTGGDQGNLLQQLLAQLSPQPQVSTGAGGAPVYTAPVQDGPVPDGSDQAPAEASLFGNPLLLAGGAIVLVLLAKPTHSRGKR